MTTVWICDEPSTLRGTLAERASHVPGVERVEIVDDVQSLSSLLSGHAADVVLLASRPSDARSAPAVRLIRQLAPHARVLLLTMGTDPDDVVAGISAGAAGYLARDAAVPEVAAALALLPAPPAPGRADGAVPAARSPTDSELTDRELQVLQGMSRGRSNSQIGEDLFLSEDTIKTHARRLFRKMRVNDRAHAVAEGFRRGLLG